MTFEGTGSTTGRVICQLFSQWHPVSLFVQWALRDMIGNTHAHTHTPFMPQSKLGMVQSQPETGAVFFSAESFGVSAQIGSGAVRGGSEVRFRRVRKGFAGFREGSLKVQQPHAVGDIT